MAKTVFDKDEAERVAVVFTPPKFPAQITKSAETFVAQQNQQGKPSFRMDPLLSIQTGINKLERLSVEERVQKEALEKVKEIQEQAYREAYQLGLDEGRERAFSESMFQFEQRLKSLDQLLNSIESMKQDLVKFNESHIMQLIFYMAKRIAMDEIKERPEIILTVIKQSIEAAQTEENVVVHISSEDLEFIQSIREKLGKDMEIIKKVQLEANETIQNGGCRVETNFGVVDADIDVRVNRLWDAIAEKLPRVRAVVGE